MPLRLAGNLVGLLGLASPTPRRWGEHEVAMLREVADYLNVALAEVVAREDRERALRELQASRAQLRELARELEATREAERTRMAREIHDVIGQALTALQMEIGLLLKQDRPSRADGERLLELIDLTIDSVHRIAANLRPSQLDDLDLRAALEWEAVGFEARSGIRCHCRVGPRELEVGTEVATAVFRVLQEALTNVARHAGAREVWIELDLVDGVLQLEVRDDGRGASPEALVDPASLGVVGMRERALAMEGQLEICGEPGRGTRLTLRLPPARAAGPGRAL